MIYFDNAATSFPKPEGVINAIEEALRFYGANPGRSGHKLALQTAKQVFACREQIAAEMGARSTEDVVFTSNCTHSLNTCIKGVLKNGDHVIISDLEHNSVLRPIHTLKEQGVIDYDILEIDEDDDTTIANLERIIRPNTRLIALTHASNVFGIISPIEKIAKVAGKSGILFLVDAAQSAGVIPINITKIGIDFLCFPGHKGFFGPTGTGVIVTTRGDLIDTVFEGGSGSNSLSYTQPEFMPDKLESGTVNTAGIIALKAGFDFVASKGMDTIYRHELKLTRQIYDGLQKIENVKLYTSRPTEGKHVPVLSFNIEGRTGEQTCALLDETGFCLRGGYHCAPLAHKKMNTLEGGSARLSLGAFNSENQVKSFLREVTRIAAVAEKESGKPAAKTVED